MRLTLLLAALCAAGSLYAQPFFGSNAPGYSFTEYSLPTSAPGSFRIHGGAAWDPTGPDIYYWDVANVVIRRFDTLAGTPAATALFTVPSGGFGPYVDTIAFDESSNDLYVGESGAQVVHKVRRTGMDSIDPTFGTGGILTSATYTFYLFDFKFDPFSRLIGSGGNSFGSPAECGVYSFNKTTLAATQIINLRVPGGTPISGPIAFDAAGNLFYALPPLFAGEPMRIAMWKKADLDTAINSAGATVLTMDEATIVIDWTDNFPSAGSMGFRREGNRDILYFTATDGGTVYRADLASHAYTIFAAAGVPHAGEVAFPSALALDSPALGFRPFSGDTARIAVVMGGRDAAFDLVRHSLCLFQPTAAPAGVVSLAVSGLPAGITNGQVFGATVELRDAGGMLMDTTNGAIEVAILSGSGTLARRTLAIAGGGVAIFDELVLTGGSGSVRLSFSLAGGSTTFNSAPIPINAGGGTSGTSNNDDSNGCVAQADGRNWLALVFIGLVATLVQVRRGRTGARQVGE